jgi:ABC-type phosphate transport system auxiliary subunit
MVMDSTAAKISLVVLAVIGALVVLSAFGMFFMHSSMMGNSTLHGLWSSMAGMCRGMMGG